MEFPISYYHNLATAMVSSECQDYVTLLRFVDIYGGKQLSPKKKQKYDSALECLKDCETFFENDLALYAPGLDGTHLMQTLQDIAYKNTEEE